MTPAYLFPSKYSGKQAASGGLSLGTLRQSVDWRTPPARSGQVFNRPLSNPPHTTEPNVVVGIVRVVVVAIGAPRVVGVVVPIAAAQHTVARVPVAPKMTFNSCLIFSISGPQSACAACPRQLFQRHSKASLLRFPLLYCRTFQRNRRRASATFWRHSRRRPGQILCPKKVTPSFVG